MSDNIVSQFIDKIESDKRKVANTFMNLAKYDMLPRCVWDWDANFIYVNEKFAQCFGYTASEMKGKPFSDFIHPEDVDKSMDEYTRNQADNNVTMIEGFTNRYICKDGSVVTVRWHGYNDFENLLGSGQIEIIK